MLDNDQAWFQQQDEWETMGHPDGVLPINGEWIGRDKPAIEKTVILTGQAALEAEGDYLDIDMEPF